MIPVITIDGPSGSGKGTIAARIARQYGLHLLDSGALYRLLGLYAGSRGWLEGVDAPDVLEAQLAAAAKGLEIDFRQSSDAEGDTVVSIFLEGQDVTQAIRTEQVGSWASQVATVPAVRDALLEWQRQCAHPPGLVADGRDMGTVVFADAPVKIFLTASVEARAQRRYSQLKNMGLDASLEHILADLQARDQRDTLRTIAPLRPAEDALYIDSSALDIPAVMQLIHAEIARRLPTCVPVMDAVG